MTEDEGNAKGSEGTAAEAGAGGANGGADTGPKGEPSLLDHASRAAEDTAAEAGAGAGAGEQGGPPTRPDYLPEKFWDPEKGQPRVDVLAKSYAELEGKLRSGAHKAPAAPDGYKLEPSEALRAAGVTGFDAKDPVLKAVLETAHAEGVSNQAMNAIANTVMQIAAEQGVGVDPKAVVEKEFQKLGPGGQALVDGLDGWGRTLKRDGILSDDELQEFRFAAGTAAGAKMMAKLRELSGEQPIPLGPGKVDGLPSEEEAYRMTADPKYGTDAAFTAKVDGIFARLFGTDQAGTSRRNLGVR